ncbi:hypothetical protein TL16_g04768 [Triparma laevis f. inornata]|uniref:Citrate transporter-like domain-containing protein n=1 Tax=Triparma laevis f. inornata TaxID=1714386 RepID=A0A9W7ABT9_9STRA|nr:hypothetical protein TL16_g04768 [Triparma laevis f. inornata]
MDELLLPVAECVEDLSSSTKKSKPEQTSSGSGRTAFYIASAIGLAIFFGTYFGASLTLQQTICVFVIYLAMTSMACFNIASDLAMFTASVILLATEVITRDQFLQGFGNSSVVCVGLLLVVAKGVEETGALERLVKFFLGKPKSRTAAQLVMMIPVLLISAFLSNTACVAMMIPIIQSWSDSINQSRSQLLLPLSYVSMMGGCLSLIGSSNNLVAYEKAKDYEPDINIGMFDVAMAGVPMTICGIIYMVCTSKHLLPSGGDEVAGGGTEGDNNNGAGTRRDQRYSMCFWVQKAKSGRPNDVYGLTPSQVVFDRPGLSFVRRHCLEGDDGVDLMLDAPFSEGELLVFKGTAGRLAQLQKTPGLVLATKEIEKLSFARVKHKADNKLSKRRHRRIIEAVIDVNSPLVGKTIKEVAFRQSYNAVVVARRPGITFSGGGGGGGVTKQRSVSSCGERNSLANRLQEEGLEMNPKVDGDSYVNLSFSECDCNTSWGAVKFCPGDSLLLVASSSFVKQYSNSSKFALVTELSNSKPPRNDTSKDLLRVWITWGMLAMIIGVSAYDDTRLLEMCVITVVVQIYFQMMTLEEAWSAVKGGTLLTIASSFSLGNAIQSSGLADIIADEICLISEPFGKIGLIAVVYFVTSLLSILVSNTAVVIFVFDPVAKAADKVGMELLPFVFILMIGSSAAYATPISYQTNLMVFAPGGYTFMDYVRFGGPLQLVSWVSTTIVVYLIWGRDD